MKLERRVRGKKDPRGYWGDIAERSMVEQCKALQHPAGTISDFFLRYAFAKEEETDWDGSVDWNEISFPWMEERKKEMVLAFWACVKVHGLEL